ncbi:MBL fold metallo-hydrolase [Cohnella nanjingensis]|uniref:MBL fold metallo-hydrolase n=1 Tax=Cohnella nanjingensis TaxID=1387779 RepID=A0A7X0VH25_9BACL|nr:MBL fold metallo-hydrolase [Cohnella nanjingensis]MBB6673043.1 MBL fold metallo-hydrolase [Cohnella nanjingensis]
MKINEKVFAAKTMLSDTTPLHTFLVKGKDFSVLIDSGVATMFGDIVGVVEQSKSSDIRFLFNTHPHADHIGSNRQLKEKYGLLVAAPVGSERWIEDMEYHYEQFCLPFPEILPHSDETKRDILGLMDGGSKVDLSVTEGMTVRLDGETQLTTLALSGHMMYEIGFIEHSTNTLILGDAITLYEGDLFPGHFSPKQYRATVKKLGELNRKHRFNQVLTAHFEPTDSEGLNKHLLGVHHMIDQVDWTIHQILSEAAEPLSLEPIWRAVCERMGRIFEFRGLAMVHGHLSEAVQDGRILQVDGLYTVR